MFRFGLSSALALLVAVGGTPIAVASAAEPEPADAGVVLEWAINGEVQAKPFFGDSNYLSAGISDGSAATYAAVAGDVAILRRTADGTVAPATWATRSAHVGAGGQAAQFVRLSAGTPTTAVDGTLDVSWSGSVTVNMYGGLVPFTLTDPTLHVDPSGTGVLTADLSGFAGEPGSADPVTPVAPVTDAVVASFHGVVADLVAGFAISPEFAGVTVALPAGATPQDTTTAGWGAWPQPFVDFHRSTGLASYFYTSGTTSTDPGKPPFDIAIGSGMSAPSIPTPQPTPTPTQAHPDGDGKGARAGRAGQLTWGVKSSFRSYITGAIAHGSVTVSSGARRVENGYRFRQKKGGSFTLARGRGSSQYDGTVRFVGHDGILDLTFSDPVVRVASKSRASLTVTTSGRHVRVADLDLRTARRAVAKGAVTYSGAPATLTAAGAELFSYGGSTFYPAGTALDPVTFTVGAPGKRTTGTTTTGAAAEWTAPAEAPTTTGARVTGTARAGDELEVSASGFLSGEGAIRAVLYPGATVLAENLVADARGRVRATVTIPEDATGAVVLTVLGSTARGIELDVAAPEAETGCVIGDATLTWGVKESFRSYISGTIANGEWTTARGAEYSTPSFRFGTATGSVDPDTGTARVAWTGSVRFTGHDGALDLTIADPRLRLDGAGGGELLVDVRSRLLDGSGWVDEKAVRFAEIEGDGSTGNSRIVSLSGTPATLTSEGAQAFAGFYDAGEQLDPIDVSITVPEECALAPGSTPAPTASATPVPEADAAALPPESTSSNAPLWPWIVGAVLVLILIAAVLVLLRRRGRSHSAATTTAG
jgi:hypothetical protein